MLPNDSDGVSASVGESVDRIYMYMRRTPTTAPASVTNLTPLDLWENPCEVVNFLRGTSSFSHLERAPPPQRRQRRRPPPEPPPLSPPLSPVSLGSPLSSLFSSFSFPSNLDLSSFSLNLSP